MIMENRTESQSRVWDLEAKQPIPQPIVQATINNVSGSWTVLYTVPDGSFVQLQELLVFNGSSGNQELRLGFLDETDSVPSGSALNQANVHFAKTIGSGEWYRTELKTALSQRWRIVAWTDASAGINVNLLLTALVLSYLV